MLQETWKRNFQSVCSIRFFDSHEFEISLFTGFKSGNYIFTHDGVNRIKKAVTVEISFIKSDDKLKKVSEHLSINDFSNRLITSGDGDFFDFSVISIEGLELDKIPSLTISSEDKSYFGSSVAVIGFQFDHPGLAVKKGIISSYKIINNQRYLLFDGILSHGNSGSPLIHIEKNEVIGIIGHKLSTIDGNYQQMIGIINTNIKMLKEATGKMEISGVDPIQVMVASQHQIKQLANDLYKTSYLGNGYALNSYHMLQILEAKGMNISGLKASEVEI